MGERADVDAATDGSGGKLKDESATQTNLAAWTELTDAEAAAGSGGGGGSGSDAGEQAGTDAGKGADGTTGSAAASGAGFLTVELRVPKVSCQHPTDMALGVVFGSTLLWRHFAGLVEPALLAAQHSFGCSPNCPPPPLSCPDAHATKACLTSPSCCLCLPACLFAYLPQVPPTYNSWVLAEDMLLFHTRALQQQLEQAYIGMGLATAAGRGFALPQASPCSACATCTLHITASLTAALLPAHRFACLPS